MLMRSSNQSMVNVIGVVPSRESLSQLTCDKDTISSVVYFTFGPASMVPNTNSQPEMRNTKP